LMTVVSFSMAYRSFRGGSGRLHTRLDTPPLINRRHPDSCLAHGSSTTGISGNRASTAWRITWTSCKQRRRRMDTRTSIDADQRERELVITRIFDAPRHL